MLGRHGGDDEGAISDALIVGISAGVVGWALLIVPYVNDPSLTLVQLLVSAAYPVADLVLLPLVLRLVFLHRTREVAHRFLLVGMLAYLAADVLYAHGNSVGWYQPGGFTDALWLVAYALVVAAAWHPSARVEPGFHASRSELTGRRLVVLGAASVLMPGAILLSAGTDTEVVRVAAFGSILLFLLIMHRMAGLMKRAHRQAEILDNLSRTDPLTGAANRRYLDQELARESDAGAPPKRKPAPTQPDVWPASSTMPNQDPDMPEASENPLLDLSSLPRLNAIHPEHVESAPAAVLEENRARIDALAGSSEPPAWRNFAQVPEDLAEPLMRM